jgi:hypothetical protein
LSWIGVEFSIFNIKNGKLWQEEEPLSLRNDPESKFREEQREGSPFFGEDGLEK